MNFASAGTVKVPGFFRSKLLIKLIVVFFVVVIGLPLLSSLFTKLNPFFTVEYGTVGVVSRWGKIVRLASSGLNTKLPWIEKVDFYNTQKIIYETSEQPEQSPFAANYKYDKSTALLNSEEQKSLADYADAPVDTSTKDGQQISIRYTLRYRLDSEKILWLAENVGTQEQVSLRIVQAQSRSVVRNVAREFPAQELYTGDVFTYQTKVEERLKESFEKNGVILDEFLVRQIKFSDQYIAAVEQKQIEQERVKTEEFIAQQEEYKKQQQIIRAEGEAKAQDLLRQTVNELVLQKMAIEKWNGVLPLYTGSGSVPFINIKP